MTTQTDIPLFPLGTTLFPGGLLPLQIFEVRYLDMIKRCLKESSKFGIVTIDHGSEVRKAGEAVTFAQVGTLASIHSFEALTPALFMIRCKGEQRFSIQHSERQMNGLWTASIELIEADHFVEVPSELFDASTALRKTLIAILEKAEPEEELAILEPYRFNDCSWVSNRWAELLPLPPPQKQHLLAMDNPRLRLDLVAEILQDLGVLDN